MPRHDDRRVVTVPLWAMEDCEGDPRDAMVLAQITWWLQPGQRSGQRRTHHLVERDGHLWMFLTDAELAAEVGMSPDQVRRARVALAKRGLIETRSAKVEGRKVTLIRSTIEEEVDSAESPNSPAAESPDQPSGDSAESRARAVPLQNQGEKPDGSTPSSTDVDSGPPRLTDEEQFEIFWKAYPARNGKKIGKRLSLAIFKRLPREERLAAYHGAVNYAQASERGQAGAMDPERFLKHRRWEDWQTPADPEPPRRGRPPSLQDTHDRVLATARESGLFDRQEGTG